MADTRGFGSQRIQARSRVGKRLISGTIGTAVVGAALAYGYFHDPSMPVAERGDRIDFSSLATVVSIEEYASSQEKGLKSEDKDDKLDLTATPVSLAAGLLKANFSVSAEETTSTLSTLIARHSAKLQKHLETRWGGNAAPEAHHASTVSQLQAAQTLAGPAVLPASLQRAGANLNPASKLTTNTSGKTSGSLSTP